MPGTAVRRAARSDEQPIDQIAYTPDQAAAVLYVSRSTIHRLIAEGQLAAFKVGTKSVRIPVEAVRAYVDHAVAEHVRRSTAASGVPERLEDPAAAQAIAAAISQRTDRGQQSA